MRSRTHLLCGVLAGYSRKVSWLCPYDFFKLTSLLVLPLAAYSLDQPIVGPIPWESWRTFETIHTFYLAGSHLPLPL